ncbi:hypothetical protein [Zhihengliuella alba]
MREHAWITESAHTTLEGRLLYVRCAQCGTRRMDLQGHPEQPPSAASRSVASLGAACAPASKPCALNH